MITPLERFMLSVRKNLVGALVAALLLSLGLLSTITVSQLADQFGERFPPLVQEQRSFERITVARVGVQAELSAVMALTNADRATVLRLSNGLIDLSGLPMMQVTLEAAVVAPGVHIADRFFATVPAGIYAEPLVGLVEQRCVWITTSTVKEPALRARLLDRGTERALFCPLLRADGAPVGMVALEWLGVERARADAVAPLQAAAGRISSHLARTAFR